MKIKALLITGLMSMAQVFITAKGVKPSLKLINCHYVGNFPSFLTV
ncbi:hypothetical protein [Shewanella denitrificans]